MKTTAKGGLAMTTPKQIRKLIELFEETPTKQMQNILSSGFLTDLRGANILQIDRDKFRRVCGFFKPNSLKQNPSRRVDNPDGTISFFVRVDRSLTSQQVLDETGRGQYTDNDVVSNMPKGEGDDVVEVVFFKYGHQITDGCLEEKYEKQNLTPADSYSVAVVNRDNPTFADDHPNCTLWRDDSGKWCYLACNRWYDERSVIVNRSDVGWGASWWFAGLRKSR